VEHYPVQRNQWNSVTGVKSLSSPLDLLSYSAFEGEKVRFDVWKTCVADHFLPLAINLGHFEKSEELIKDTFANIFGASCPDEDYPSLALRGLSKLMNTMVVNLMQKRGSFKTNLTEIRRGVSEKALLGYCSFHHLLLAVANSQPKVVELANQKVNDFLNNSNKRNKQHTPDLGEFLVYLTLSTKTWKDVCLVFLKELLVRNVRWIVKDHPFLSNVKDKDKYVQNFKREKEQMQRRRKKNSMNEKEKEELEAEDVGGEWKRRRVEEVCYWDQNRLRVTLEASKVSLRLVMFQVYFLNNIGRLPECSIFDLLRMYNTRHGFPTMVMKRKLHLETKKILSVANWSEFFERIEVEGFSERDTVELLKQAVVDSEQLGYHRPSPKFYAPSNPNNLYVHY